MLSVLMSVILTASTAPVNEVNDERRRKDRRYRGKQVSNQGELSEREEESQ